MAGGIKRTAGRMNLEINVAEIARTAHNCQPWLSRRGPPANLSRTAFPQPRQGRGLPRVLVPVALIRSAAFNGRVYAGIDQLPHAAEVSALPVSATASRAAQELIVQ